MSFEPLRPKLIRVAYRMLGSVQDAEDAVQDAFIRWMNIDHSDINEPEAFLRRTVTRLCLDQLKSARHQRETYIGPWLPDPIVEEDEIEDVTLPLMLALERLSPLERAVFSVARCLRIGIRRGRGDYRTASQRPAVNSPPAHANMFAVRGLVSS